MQEKWKASWQVHAGKLDEKFANRFIHWRALRPTADQALRGPQLWGPGIALPLSLSHLWGTWPSDACSAVPMGHGAGHAHQGLPHQKQARLWPGCQGHVPHLWTTSQQGLPAMASQWGGSPWAGGPVACGQCARGAIGHVPFTRGGLSSGHHVFPFHDCLFHSHNSREFEDAWLHTTARERQKETEKDEKYVRITCGYTLVTIWEYEWVSLKSNDPNTAAGVGRQVLSVTASHICQCQVLVCRPLGPICRHFSWSYTRTSPRWISIHPTGWRTSSGTYHPSSNPWRCPRRALDRTWPGSMRMLVT